MRDWHKAYNPPNKYWYLNPTSKVAQALRKATRCALRKQKERSHD